ncbi:hypothetical protein K438DRAFT_1990806 [Mycena galopus ATCC 62051]|nr:hypothetical protein K438DRAFT_1990806 [Mycena galopus ATCC 62051]
MSEGSIMDLNVMLDLMIHRLFRQAAGKAAFYTATPSLRCGYNELPDLIDADVEGCCYVEIFHHGIIDPTIANVKLILLLYKEKVEWQVIVKKKELTEEFWDAVEGLVAESVDSYS